MIARACFIAVMAGLLAACTPPAEKPAQNPRLAMAGVERQADMEAFLATLKAAIAEGDRAAVAGMVRYPFTRYAGGEALKTYPDATGLLRDYDALFTPAVKKAAIEANAATIFVNQQGAMLGDGNIWLLKATPDSPILITAINP